VEKSGEELVEDGCARGEDRRMQSGGAELLAVFARLAGVYWLDVFPRVCHERRRARARAGAIPDPLLRDVALRSLDKWGNVEGAAAFAALAPRAHRTAATRAMACYQTAYNYLDLLGEQPAVHPLTHGGRLHSALLLALDPDATAHPDYYEHLRHEDEAREGGDGVRRAGEAGQSSKGEGDSKSEVGSRSEGRREDGGYLSGLIDVCRAALRALPAWTTVAPEARAAAQRIVAFQSANTQEGSQTARDGLQGDLVALEQWARSITPADSGLCWWETAAAGGSSMGVYALIALAGESDPSPDRVAAVANAYFPWIGALHSLLDNVVDVAEDRATGQHSLSGRYDSPAQAATHMGWLARRSLAAAQGLPQGRAHALVLAAMASFYLSTPQARTPAAAPVARAVLQELGGSARLTMPVFRVRMLATRMPAADAADVASAVDTVGMGDAAGIAASSAGTVNATYVSGHERAKPG
jgi:tetraprenyl-beta-curcumene synthase